MGFTSNDQSDFAQRLASRKQDNTYLSTNKVENIVVGIQFIRTEFGSDFLVKVDLPSRQEEVHAQCDQKSGQIVNFSVLKFTLPQNWLDKHLYTQSWNSWTLATVKSTIRWLFPLRRVRYKKIFMCNEAVLSSCYKHLYEWKGEMLWNKMTSSTLNKWIHQLLSLSPSPCVVQLGIGYD